jgi:hypothetical protein
MRRVLSQRARSHSAAAMRTSGIFRRINASRRASDRLSARVEVHDTCRRGSPRLRRTDADAQVVGSANVGRVQQKRPTHPGFEDRCANSLARFDGFSEDWPAFTHAPLTRHARRANGQSIDRRSFQLAGSSVIRTRRDTATAVMASKITAVLSAGLALPPSITGR